MSVRYQCKVCQYLHEGDAPPKRCPWCSVGPEEFGALDEAGNLVFADRSAETGLWCCSVCGAECGEGTLEEVAGEDWVCPDCGAWRDLLRKK